MRKPKCKTCGSSIHYTAWCFATPKTTPKTYSKPLQRTKLRKQGKHAYQWRKTRNEWFEKNHAEYYNCYICGKTMSKQHTQLDHVESRTRRPDLRYDLNNLKPICATDNRAKGSMSLEQYLAMRDEARRA